MMNKQEFEIYYQNYISCHKNPYNKILHFLGTVLTVLYIWWIIWLGLNVHYFAFGYLWFWPNVVRILAWPGHYFLEHNIPLGRTNKWAAKFSDWRLIYEVCVGKVPLDGRNIKKS